MPALRPSLRLALTVVACVASAATPAAPRTFVASTGNDANSCSLVLPCRAFARALTQTDAGGEIVILDSAGYGPVVIGKSVSISAPPGIYGGISVGAGQNGVDVNGAGIRVALPGLRINGAAGSNDGVRFQAGAELRIERCAIESLGGIGVVSENSTHVVVVISETVVSDHRTNAIDVVGDGAKVVSSRNTISGGGIGLAPRLGGAIFTSADNVLFDHTGADVINALTPLTLR